MRKPCEKSFHSSRSVFIPLVSRVSLLWVYIIYMCTGCQLWLVRYIISCKANYSLLTISYKLGRSLYRHAGPNQFSAAYLYWKKGAIFFLISSTRTCCRLRSLSESGILVSRIVAFTPWSNFLHFLGSLPKRPTVIFGNLFDDPVVTFGWIGIVVDTRSPCITDIKQVPTNNQNIREREGRVEASRRAELTLAFHAKASRIYTGARVNNLRSNVYRGDFRKH